MVSKSFRKSLYSNSVIILIIIIVDVVVCFLFSVNVTKNKMQTVDEMTEEETLNNLESLIARFQTSLSNLYGVTTSITIYRDGDHSNTIHFPREASSTHSIDQLKIAFVVDFEDLDGNPRSSTADLIKAFGVVGNRKYVDAIKSFTVTTITDRREDITSWSIDQRRVDEMRLLTTVNQYLNKTSCEQDF